MLKLAPILYMIVGSWVYSNQQTFYNKVAPNKRSEVFMPANHEFSTFWTEVTPATVFVVYLFFVLMREIFYLVVNCSSGIRQNIKEKYNVMVEHKVEDETQKDLDPFINAIYKS